MGYYVKVRPHRSHFQARLVNSTNKQETYLRKGNLLFEGFHASGKSLIFNKFVESAEKIYKLPVIWLKNTDSLSDIFFNNGIVKDEIDGEFCTANKEKHLIQKSKDALVLVDSIDKFTGKKLELLKRLLASAKKYIITTTTETAINPTIRKILSKKTQPQTILLSSQASKDATNWLFIAFLIFIALLGFYEIAFLIAAGRFAMRGVKTYNG